MRDALRAIIFIGAVQSAPHNLKEGVMKKQNRTWAQRSEAVAVLAEHPNASGAEVLALLFNSKQEEMVKEAKAMTASVIARKKAEAEKATKEAAALEQKAKQA